MLSTTVRRGTVLGAMAAALLASACWELAASEIAYKDWIVASPEWKRGYAFAVASWLSQVTDTRSADDLATTRAYNRCLANNTTDAALAKAIDNYYARNPRELPEPLIGVAIKVMREICAGYLPRRN